MPSNWVLLAVGSLDAGGGLTASNGFAIPLEADSAYAFAASRMLGSAKEYVISFGGTDDLGDIQSDGATFGFSLYYQRLQGLFAETLLQAAADKANGIDVKLLITGHSLGGAAAQAAFADLLTPAGVAVWSDPAAPLGLGQSPRFDVNFSLWRCCFGPGDDGVIKPLQHRRFVVTQTSAAAADVVAVDAAQAAIDFVQRVGAALGALLASAEVRLVRRRRVRGPGWRWRFCRHA